MERKAGQRHLGAAVGSAEFVTSYLENKVTSWSKQVNKLADVVSTKPHAAYSAFAFGLRHRWTFVQHTMPTAGHHMEPLKEAIHSKLIPMPNKYELNNLEMELVTLPTRYGGMSFDDPVSDAPCKHMDSLESTTTLMGLIFDREPELPTNVDFDQEAKAEIRSIVAPKRQRLTKYSPACWSHSTVLWSYVAHERG